MKVSKPIITVKLELHEAKSLVSLLDKASAAGGWWTTLADFHHELKESLLNEGLI